METDRLTDYAPAFKVLLAGMAGTSLAMRAVDVLTTTQTALALIMAVGVALTGWTTWRKLPRQPLERPA